MKLSIISLFALTLLSSLGCASEPTSAQLAISHPAHPDAKQAACCDKNTSAISTTGGHNHGATAAPAAAAAAVGHDAHAGHAAPASNAAKTKAIPYPLETCLVSGEKLGSMGKPFEFVHDGREIKLCCKSCEKEFKADPAKFIKKFDDAVKAKNADKNPAK